MPNLDEQLYAGAIKGGAKENLARFIVAQARHESGNYTNKQTLVNNNPFGFKYVGQPLASKGNISPEGGAYAKYDTIENASKDYLTRWYRLKSKKGGIRLDEFNQYKTPEEYARALKSYGYFADLVKGNDEEEINRYTAGIKRALNKIEFDKFAKPVGLSLAGIVLLATIGYTLYVVFKFKK